MAYRAEPSVATWNAVFAEEVAAVGGAVTETLRDESRLFVRSILPWIQDVAPRDQVRGGVALKAVETDVWVHPYVFRQVCSNGANMAHAIQSTHLSRLDWLLADDAREQVRSAIQDCCVEDAFLAAVEEIRSARFSHFDSFLSIVSELTGRSGTFPPGVQEAVLLAFFRTDDRTRFGLMNAVTSVARDTADPETRWDLETLGGAIATPPVDPRSPLAQAVSLNPATLPT